MTKSSKRARAKCCKYLFVLSEVADADSKLQHYNQLLLELSPVNYSTLKRLILHLTQYVFSTHSKHICTDDDLYCFVGLQEGCWWCDGYQVSYQLATKILMMVIEVKGEHVELCLCLD